MCKLMIPLCLAALVSASGAALAFDRATTNAAKACHDYIWEVPEFAELPNAAISVWPSTVNEGTYVINWNVNWDDPTVRAAGNCTVKSDEVIGYEDYTKMK
ncbi:MAG: hypothetical protein AAGC96_17590 [Pseudomonadota bacterium]